MASRATTGCRQLARRWPEGREAVARSSPWPVAHATTGLRRLCCGLEHERRPSVKDSSRGGEGGTPSARTRTRRRAGSPSKPQRTSNMRQGAGASSERRRTARGVQGSNPRRQNARRAARRRTRSPTAMLEEARPANAWYGTSMSPAQSSRHEEAEGAPSCLLVTSKEGGGRLEKSRRAAPHHAVASTVAPRGGREESCHALLPPPTKREREESVSLPPRRFATAAKPKRKAGRAPPSHVATTSSKRPSAAIGRKERRRAMSTLSHCGGAGGSVAYPSPHHRQTKGRPRERRQPQDGQKQRRRCAAGEAEIFCDFVLCCVNFFRLLGTKW